LRPPPAHQASPDKPGHLRQHLAHVPANLCGLEKEQAAPTWKRTFGFHPLAAFAEDTRAAILKVPADSWTPAYDGDGRVTDGAWVADITGMLDLSSWPAGMRVIVRKERPHPGAQLRFTDIDGHRFTAFATDARKGQLADLELRHRRRARCEDRIRNAKDTGLRNLPLKGFAQNQLWCEIVSLACELLAWTQMLALTGTARRWEPKRLRLRLFSAAGRLARGGRRLRLRLAERWPWARQITTAVTRLQAIPSG
jgi:Transposase DDE domain group 1